MTNTALIQKTIHFGQYPILVDIHYIQKIIIILFC